MSDKRVLFGKVTLFIIFALILMKLSTVLIPPLQNSGTELTIEGRCSTVGCYYNTTTSVCQIENANSTGCPTSTTIPLQGLFSSSGVIMLLVAAFIFMLIFLAAKKFIGR